MTSSSIDSSLKFRSFSHASPLAPPLLLLPPRTRGDGSELDTRGLSFLRSFFSSRKQRSRAILTSPQALKNFMTGFSSWHFTRAWTSPSQSGCGANKGGCIF